MRNAESEMRNSDSLAPRSLDDFATWERSASEDITADPLWRIKAYRLALYAVDVGWPDVTRLAQDDRTIKVSGQLCRALGSIAANIAEGFSRGSHKDRVRLYEYALGSARESRGWYYEGRHVVSVAVAEERYSLLNQIIRLLLAMIPEQRGYTVREEAADYAIEDISSEK